MEKDTEKPVVNGEKMENEPIRDENGRIISGVLNPKGRPRGSESFKTKWLRMIDKLAEQNMLSPEEIDEQLLLVGYKKAKDGEYNFYRDVMDRIHGKPMQPTDITSDGKALEKTIIINKS